MVTMINFALLLCVIQVYANAIPLGLENATDSHEERFLLAGLISRRCKDQLNTVSSVAPALKVTITKLSNNGAYFFSPFDTDLLTFDAANQFCQDHGMHLVTINSATENDLVYAEAQRVTLSGVADASAAWIGMRDVTGGGRFQWIQKGVPTSATYFDSGSATNTECAAYTDSTGLPATQSWESDPCDDAIAFICELEYPCNIFV